MGHVSSISSIRSDLHRWLAAFPNPDGLNNDQEEVIYEDWGKCVCLSYYTREQHDMLVLAFDFNHVHFCLQITFFVITWVSLCFRLPSGAVCAAVCGKPS